MTGPAAPARPAAGAFAGDAAAHDAAAADAAAHDAVAADAAAHDAHAGALAADTAARDAHAGALATDTAARDATGELAGDTAPHRAASALTGDGPDRRPTGPLAGAWRAARLVGEATYGLAAIELAHRRRGAEGARRAFRRAAGRMCDVFGLDVRVEGALPEAPEVRVANHVSYLDILALASTEAGRFLSRHDVAGWPVVGRVARRCGTVFVDRDSTSARAVALRSLASAARRAPAVLVFPEGGTGLGALRPFQAGAFLVARHAKVPVRPLALAYDAPSEVAWVDGVALSASAWRRLCGPRVRLRIFALEAVDPGEGSAGELAERCRRAIGAALEAGAAGARG